jgi:hypothetical protein
MNTENLVGKSEGKIPPGAYRRRLILKYILKK